MYIKAPFLLNTKAYKHISSKSNENKKSFAHDSLLLYWAMTLIAKKAEKFHQKMMMQMTHSKSTKILLAVDL